MRWTFLVFQACFALFHVACGSVLAETVELEFNSVALDEARPILVRLPEGYEEGGAQRYPVLVVLNEKDNFEWASYIVGLQASRGAMDDMFVVGLPATDNYSGDNYPFAKTGSLELNDRSQAYSHFIREEALPYIEQNYRTNGGRFIVGHSLSGLMVTHMMTQYPDAFSTFIILSPSLQHAPQLLGVLSDFFKTNGPVESQAYFALGSLEHETIQQGFSGLSEVLKADAPDGWSHEQTILAHTDHMLAAFKGTYDSLAWLYRDFSIPTDRVQAMKASEIIDHYARLSRQLNYRLLPRQRGMTGLGWFLEKRIGNKAAALEVLKAAAHFYPEDEKIKSSVARLECRSSDNTATTCGE
ncbi:MAG: hypothetical protein HWE08_13655 [Alphaproteobacteria bacterium]|nr:hypothetical protein [Alphaproteobacteria bacterium]